MRTALYLRVSTGEQTTENQRRELLAAADRLGWKVVEIYEDAGVSGNIRTSETLPLGSDVKEPG